MCRQEEVAAVERREIRAKQMKKHLKMMGIALIVLGTYQGRGSNHAQASDRQEKTGSGYEPRITTRIRIRSHKIH